MSIVAIGSKYVQESTKVAEYVALKLGYRLVTMAELVRATAQSFNIPEKELATVTTDLTLHWWFFGRRKMHKVALLEFKLCEWMAEDQMVFCGYLGYPLFREVSHALKVLVLAHPEPSIPGGEGNRSVTELQSNAIIPKWHEIVYHVPMEDPNIYDLTLNLWHMDVSEAGDVIINTLQKPRFTPMTYSVNCLANMALACRVKTVLAEEIPDVEVKTHSGSVYIYSKRFKKSGRKKAMAVKEAVMRMDGVQYVEVYRDRSIFDDM